MLAIASGTTNKIAKFNSTTTVGDSTISDNGSTVNISTMSGASTRMVVADSSGTLGTQTIPVSGVSPVQYNSVSSFGFGFSTPSIQEPTITTPNNVFVNISGTTVTNTSSVSRWFIIMGEVSVKSDAVTDDFILYMIVDGNVVAKDSRRVNGWSDGGELMAITRMIQLAAGQSVNVSLNLKSFGIGKRSGASVLGVAI
jgi:hypothetical protein